MGDNDDGILEVDQKFLKPCDGVQVQMIGGLVEQKDVRVPEQRLCEQDLDFLRSGQVFQIFIVKVRFYPEPVQQSRGVRFRFPAVHCGKLCLQLACFDSVFICKIFLCVDDLFLLHDLIEARISHNNGIQHRIFIVFEMILLKKRETLAGSDADIALRRLELS